ncbi:MAG: DNA polymerase IV [Planctomycetota bacterium]
MALPRIIAHVDMDAFFASVEQRDHPEWRGLPVLVGGAGRRGVVAAASYEARAFGCRSAMPMAVALRKCPDAIIAPPRGSVYREVSKQIFTEMDALTPLVQPLSVDEAFLDLAGVVQSFEDAVDFLEAFRARIRTTLQLTISAGIAPNKFIAKLASDEHKPDGLTLIRPADTRNYLDPLPIERMWGVGPATADRLHHGGFRTFADLIAADTALLSRVVGREAGRLQALARGEDDRAVVSDRHARTYSQERTFGHDLESPDLVLAVLQAQVEHVLWRLRRADRRAKTLTLKIRDGSFRTITRSRTFDEAHHRTTDFWQAAREVFEQWAASSFVPVRLIGFGVSHVEAGEAPQTLFPDATADRQDRIDNATDAIADRFGVDAIQRGLSTMQPNRRSSDHATEDD